MKLIAVVIDAQSFLSRVAQMQFPATICCSGRTSPSLRTLRPAIISAGATSGKCQMGVVMKQTIIACLGVVSLSGACANAADLPAPIRAAPPLAPVAVASDWTGFYLGGHGGYGWGHNTFSENTGSLDIGGSGIFLPNVALSGLSSKGWVGGFQAGYNWQYHSWVAGLEVDLSGADINGTVSKSASSSGTSTLLGPVSGSVTASETDKFEMLGSARARVGYLITPTILLYGTGGLGWTRLVQSPTLIQNFTVAGITSTTSAVSSATVSFFGWTAGAGGEMKIYDNWLLRVEYLHYDFGDENNSSITNTTSGVPVSNGAITNGSRNLNVDVVRGGLSYKF
jgi:opacity protein-like surface antigen